MKRMPVINPVNLKMYRGIEKVPALNPSIGGLHLEDIASRLSVILTYYAPQGLLAIAAMQRPFETWGRNMLAWAGTLAVAYVAKNQNVGINTFLDTMMRPKGSPYKTVAPIGLANKAKFYLKNPKAMINKAMNPIATPLRN